MQGPSLLDASLRAADRVHLARQSLLVCKRSADKYKGGNVSLACALKQVKGPHFAHIVDESMGSSLGHGASKSRAES